MKLLEELKNKKTTIFFRVDSGTDVGYGHFVRCIALALVLSKTYKIIFITRYLKGNLIQSLNKKTFSIKKLSYKSKKINQIKDANETISIIKKSSNKKNILIVDSYNLSETWEKKIKLNIDKLIVIDDLKTRKHICDMIIDQNLHSSMKNLYKDKIPKNCIKLFGPDYAILRNQFIKERQFSSIRSLPIKKILVSFGGSDKENYTMPALYFLKNFEYNFKIFVVVGKANSKKNSIRNFCLKNSNFKYFEQIENMAKLMKNSDICIGSSGTTTWERCCLGLPGITVISSMDQYDIAKAMSTKNCIINLGTIKPNKINFRKIFLNLTNNDLKSMSKNSMKLVDGKGSLRIEKSIVKNFGR